jgi:hypothetical protein
MMINIKDRINSYQRFGPEYDRMLANHLPMALWALHRLGATDDDLNRFAETYTASHDLPPVSPPAGISLNDRNWESYKGKREYFSNFRAFFSIKLQELGREGFLRSCFNPLMAGISAAAYHALIRLAYGVDSDNDEEILSGMAYLAASCLQLQGPLPALSGHAIPLREQINFVSEELSAGRLVLPKMNGVIFERMGQVSQKEVLVGIAGRLAIPTGASLKDFAEITLDLYLSTKNFTLLHTVTACHASRIMMPYIDDKTLYLKYFYQALVAAYITVGAPHIGEQAPYHIDKNQIEKIKAAACKASDDHDIKLTYTAREEYRAYQNPLYLKAAVQLYSSKINRD